MSNLNNHSTSSIIKRSTHRSLKAIIALGFMQTAIALPVHASGVVTESRPVSNVRSVILEDVGELILTESAQESLVVEAEKSVLPKMITKLSNGTLTLALAGSVNTREPIRYKLNVKKLEQIEIKGSGDIQATNLKNSPTLKVTSSGSGNITLHNLNTKQFTFNSSGSGDIHIDGKTQKQTITLDGANNYDAAKFDSSEAHIDLSGAGNAKLAVKDRISGSISGAGNVDYTGHPKDTIKRD
ncbi:MAG: head GIN domain-containing protein [Pseudomonadota bacterium]